MRIVVLLSAAIACLFLAPPALAAQCACKIVKASSEGTGLCERSETPASCHMAWVTRSGGSVSFAPFYMEPFAESNKTLKKLKDFNFKFTVPGTGPPIASAPQYLVETPPSKYGGDESLSPYLLILATGMRKIGMDDTLEVAGEIIKSKVEVISALKGGSALSLGLRDGTLLASKGCLEFVRPAGSVMVNTHFSEKAASCG